MRIMLSIAYVRRGAGRVMERRAFFAIVRSVCLGLAFCGTAISHGVAAPARESLPTITIDAPDAPKPATVLKPKRPSSAQRRPTRPVQPAPAVDSAVAGGS